MPMDAGLKRGVSLGLGWVVFESPCGLLRACHAAQWGTEWVQRQRNTNAHKGLTPPRLTPG